MIPALVPQHIVDLHRALLATLRVDYFAPGMQDMNNWRDFLFVMEPLKDSAGGELTIKDIGAAVALMRKQNRAGSNWSLRFTRIMRDPESFRDLVLQSRRVDRPRQPVQRGSRTDATGAQIATERDPAAEDDARPVSAETQRFMKELADRKARRAQ